jgi:hypothetical protein
MVDLRDQLRTLIDSAAEPVHVDEVAGRPVLVRLTPARPSRRTLATALAGVAVIALAVVGAAAVATTDDPADEDTTAATTAMTADADPASCYPDPCRAVDDAEASALLGTPVAMPSGLPDGWELVSSEVAFYPAGVEFDGMPPSPVDAVVLRRSWSPPGESFTEGCPTSIQLRAIPDHPGHPYGPQNRPTFLTLPDGTPVLGSVGPGVCGDPTGEASVIGDLTWTHAGVEYQLRSFGAPAEALRSVVTSLP